MGGAARPRLPSGRGKGQPGFPVSPSGRAGALAPAEAGGWGNPVFLHFVMCRCAAHECNKKATDPPGTVAKEDGRVGRIVRGGVLAAGPDLSVYSLLCGVTTHIVRRDLSALHRRAEPGRVFFPSFHSEFPGKGAEAWQRTCFPHYLSQTFPGQTCSAPGYLRKSGSTGAPPSSGWAGKMPALHGGSVHIPGQEVLPISGRLAYTLIGMTGLPKVKRYGHSHPV